MIHGFDLNSPLVCEGIIGDGCGGGRIFYIKDNILNVYDPQTKETIIFMVDDLGEYNSNRGFVLDMYEELTPGPKVCKNTDLVKEIGLCLSNNSYYEAERVKANKLLNSAPAPYSRNIIKLMQKKIV